jgi:selenide,water dikinase
MAVTGLVNPKQMFANTEAKLGDFIYLSKPLGTGIATTAAKNDAASEDELQAAVNSMSKLNREACEIGLRHNVRCATDITGFGLVGHLYNIARSSQVGIEIDSAALPTLPGIQRMVEEGHVTGGSRKNRTFLGEYFSQDDSVAAWLTDLAFDPQTSGGLALFSPSEIPGYPRIGRVVSQDVHIRLV